MAKTIARLSDGFVTEWYLADEPVPHGCVEIPAELMAKYRTGEIADGVSLAKAALAGAASPAAKPVQPAQASGRGAVKRQA